MQANNDIITNNKQMQKEHQNIYLKL